MKFRFIRLIAALVTGLTPASASAFACSGELSRLGSGNSLTIDVGYGTWYICSLETGFGGIDPKSCAAWYALLTSAKLTGQNVMLYFDPANSYNQGISDCATMGSWVTRVPYFIEILPSASLKETSPPPPRTR